MAKKRAILELNSFFSEMTSHLPKFATFEKVLGEFLEHKDFAFWVFIRIIIPIIVFHLVVNILIFERFWLSSSIFGVVIFFYATFLVDLDSFFNKKKGSKEATRAQKILILLLTPAVIYYMLSKKIKPLHVPDKFFHKPKSMLVFVLFAFLLGYLIFLNFPDALFFALFGFIGYFTHLFADGIIVLKKN